MNKFKIKDKQNLLINFYKNGFYRSGVLKEDVPSIRGYHNFSVVESSKKVKSTLKEVTTIPFKAKVTKNKDVSEQILFFKENEYTYTYALFNEKKELIVKDLSHCLWLTTGYKGYIDSFEKDDTFIIDEVEYEFISYLPRLKETEIVSLKKNYEYPVLKTPYNQKELFLGYPIVGETRPFKGYGVFDCEREGKIVLAVKNKSIFFKYKRYRYEKHREKNKVNREIFEGIEDLLAS